MKVSKLAFEFLPRFKSKSNSACAIVQRDDSSTIVLSMDFSPRIQNIEQITVIQAIMERTGQSARTGVTSHACGVHVPLPWRRHVPPYYGQPWKFVHDLGCCRLLRAPRDTANAGVAVQATRRTHTCGVILPPCCARTSRTGRRTAK
jgi:hypothetical protein